MSRKHPPVFYYGLMSDFNQGSRMKHPDTIGGEKSTIISDPTFHLSVTFLRRRDGIDYYQVKMFDLSGKRHRPSIDQIIENFPGISRDKIIELSEDILKVKI